MSSYTRSLAACTWSARACSHSHGTRAAQKGKKCILEHLNHSVPRLGGLAPEPFECSRELPAFSIASSQQEARNHSPRALRSGTLTQAEASAYWSHCGLASEECMRHRPTHTAALRGTFLQGLLHICPPKPVRACWCICCSSASAEAASISTSLPSCWT